MRRLALATATFLALVTGAVTPAQADWNIYVTVSAPMVPEHAFVYRDAQDTINFPTKVRCEAWMNGPDFAADVRDEFEANEGLEHGADTTIVWTCVEKAAPQTNL